MSNNVNPHFIFCLIGDAGIVHSRSPWIHQQFADEFRLTVVSERAIIPDNYDTFQTAVKTFQQRGHAFHVTAPFKEQAYAFAHQHSERARIARSVNTCWFLPDGKIFGDNVDGFGFIRDLKQNLNYSLHKKTIVILGAGGAVRGILHPLLNESPHQLIIANRTIEKAHLLANEFSPYGNVHGCGFDDLSHCVADFVIDATRLQTPPPLPDSFQLSSHSLCYDLKYSNTPTAFMQWAIQKNATQVTDGIGMLVEERAEAFFLWTGYRPATQPVLTLAKTIANKN